METIYTLEEVAEIVKLPTSTLYKHLTRGKLKGVKLGRHWRITETNLQEYLKDDSGLDKGVENRTI
jgi:excisionase family DNA binding protein